MKININLWGRRLHNKAEKGSKAMDAADITSLTGAFSVDSLLSTFVGLAPFILTVAGVVIGVSLIKWGVKTVRRKLSGGVA